jgi:hypothetical protein
MQILNNYDMQRLAPSIFATQPWDRMSEKYKFIPTIAVIDAMRDNNFHPTHAMQSKTRIEGRGDFTKHLIRFRHNDYISPSNIGQEVPEIVMVNSHDGSSAYQLMAGIFRLVCSNGMIIQSADMGRISTRHSGNNDVVGEVIEGSFQIMEDTPKQFAAIEHFKQVEVSTDQQRAYAAAALEIKGEDASKTFNADHLLFARRRADTADNMSGARDLWRTFNCVQENMIRGGVRGRSPSGRRATSRAVKSVNEDIRINRALWRLTDEMAKLAA